MKRLFRAVVAAIVCALLLASAAWGRSINGLRCTHPIGDDFSLAASAPLRGFHVILIIALVPGTVAPVVVISPPGSGVSERTSAKPLAVPRTLGGRR
jgi:hypothetical protein